MDFQQNFKVESIKFYKKIIFIDVKICRALSQQSSKCITMDFKKWIAFACRFSIILLFYMYLVGTGSYTDRKVILMDVHVFLVAKQQATPIKTIYRKVLFTSLLFKVARKYSFLRIGGLKTASLYSGGKKKAPNVDYRVLKKFLTSILKKTIAKTRSRPRNDRAMLTNAGRFIDRNPGIIPVRM